MPVQTNIDDNQLRYRLFVGNERVKVRGNAFWIRALEQGYLIDYRRENPKATKEQLVERLAWYHQVLLQKGMSDQMYGGAYQIIAGGLQALADAGFNPWASLAGSALKSLLDGIGGPRLQEWISVQDNITGSWQTFATMRKLFGQVDALHEQVLRTADDDRAFGDARDAFFGSLSGASVYDSAAILLKDPILQTWINTETITEMLNIQKIDGEQLIAFIREEFKKITGKLNAGQREAIDTAIRMGDRYPITEHGERATSDTYTSALAQAERAEVVLDAARSAIGLISALASQADPKLGKQIEILGSGMIQLATAVTRYIPSVAGLGLGQALGSLSTVALTGNLLGAVMTLLPLFLGSQDPEDIILDELHELRLDIYYLQRGMTNRFDRIERGLDTIYTDMLYNFDRVIELQTRIGEQISEIGHALVTLQSRLDEVGQRIAAALEAIQQRELKEQINYALGYQQRYHNPLPYSDFVRAENRFQIYATHFSLDDASTAPVEQPGHVNNVEIDPAIAGSELHRNLGYLAWLASQRFNHSIQVRKLPSPVVWSLAARAYTQLIGENANHAGKTTRQPSIRAAGAQLDHLVRDISKPISGTTNILFTRLIDNYREALQGVSNALRTEHDSVLAGRQINIFGDVAQGQPSLAHQPRMGDLSTPATMQPNYALPAPIYTALDAFRVDRDIPELVTSYGIWLHPTEEVRKPKFVSKYGNAGITVQTLFRFSQTDEWQVVRSVSQQKWSGRYYHEDKTGAEPVKEFTDFAGIIRSEWESGGRSSLEAVNPTLDTAAVDRITAATAEYLRTEAKRYLMTVSEKLRQPSELRTSITGLTGAATLLRSYTQIGFPKALETDDLLSAMINGYRSIISETVDAPMISTTFAVAITRFILCAPNQSSGCTAREHLYEVLWQQPYLSEGVPTTDVISLPGEPVGNAIVSSAIARLNLLKERFGVHSKRLADGQYVEGLQLVEELDSRLSLTESLMLPDIISNRVERARTYIMVGLWQEAEALYEEIVTDRESLLGPIHPDTIASRSRLALLAYLDGGRREEALSVLKRTLVDLEHLLGPDHPETVASRVNLAVAYQAAGRLDRALPLLERTLTDFEQLLGAHDRETMAIRHNLADAYQAPRWIEETLPILECILADRDGIVEAGQPDTLLSRDVLGSAYQAARQLHNAVWQLEQALLVGRSNLAKGYQAVGRPKKARPLLERILAEQERVFGPDHPHTTTSRRNLAAVYLALGRSEDAVPLMERAVFDCERLLGHDDLRTLISQANLAVAYMAIGRPEDALQQLECVNSDIARVLGPHGPESAISLGNRAGAYVDSERPDIAPPLLEIDKREHEKSLGTPHLERLPAELVTGYQTRTAATPGADTARTEGRKRHKGKNEKPRRKAEK